MKTPSNLYHITKSHSPPPFSLCCQKCRKCVVGMMAGIRNGNVSIRNGNVGIRNGDVGIRNEDVSTWNDGVGIWYESWYGMFVHPSFPPMHADAAAAGVLQTIYYVLHSTPPPLQPNISFQQAQIFTVYIWAWLFGCCWWDVIV
ncbi:hypothetical protein L873DRAFT_79846 [Choiromyces venosus 120613-1]|uniref:Uncharacterized protein n=1 Tax=Choiromyces venosus 120613-1 TaxID=1336337 RepID=A0A3N4J4J2_9PEZI|nr:hypothetical protein L873DRAFT_79846 [Choiromyces venosus 120613-1]